MTDARTLTQKHKSERTPQHAAKWPPRLVIFGSALVMNDDIPVYERPRHSSIRREEEFEKQMDKLISAGKREPMSGADCELFDEFQTRIATLTSAIFATISDLSTKTYTPSFLFYGLYRERENRIKRAKYEALKALSETSDLKDLQAKAKELYANSDVIAGVISHKTRDLLEDIMSGKNREPQIVFKPGDIFYC